MTANQPATQSFRLEPQSNGLVHLVFDMPGRTMNVFSNSAIHELGAIAAWLKQCDAKGVLIRSGKDSAFCAGADLTELGVAYGMIMQAPPENRHKMAFDHFFPLSSAIRELERCGKPVAAVISGLALGGGCEFALGAHYRVLTDSPQAVMGLPESLVGLLPGGGGTQRMPRVIGPEASLPILLNAARLGGQDALKAGLVHEIVAPEVAVAAAERWLLANPNAKQPWDEANYIAPGIENLTALIAAERDKILGHTLGHEPAPLAILNCVEHGLPLPIDQAIRKEMDIFAALIIRPEPRNMIRTMFRGKGEYDKAKKGNALAPEVAETTSALAQILKSKIAANPELAPALARAGFALPGQPAAHEGAPKTDGYWFTLAPDNVQKALVRETLAALKAEAKKRVGGLTDEQQRQADYLLVKSEGFPAYLGGVFSLLADD